MSTLQRWQVHSQHERLWPGTCIVVLCADDKVGTEASGYLGQAVGAERCDQEDISPTTKLQSPKCRVERRTTAVNQTTVSQVNARSGQLVDRVRGPREAGC